MRKLFGWYNQLQATSNLKIKEIKEGAEQGDTKTDSLIKEKQITHKPKDFNKVGIKTQAGNRKTAGVRKSGDA